MLNIEIIWKAFIEGFESFAIEKYEAQKDNERRHRAFPDRRDAINYAKRIVHRLLVEDPAPAYEMIPINFVGGGPLCKPRMYWRPGHAFIIKTYHDCNGCGWPLIPGNTAYRIHQEHVCQECYENLLIEYDGNLDV